MTRSVWLKADDEVGDWTDRRDRILAGLDAGVDWVLVDQADVERVRELGKMNVAAFRTDGDVSVIDDPEGEGVVADPDAAVIGKRGEGDGTIDLPEDFSGSADLSSLRRDTGGRIGAYVRLRDESYQSFAEAVAEAADLALLIGEDWQVKPLEDIVASVTDKAGIIAGVTSAAEAKTAFEAFDCAPNGVLLDADDPEEIQATVDVRDHSERESLDLGYAPVAAVESVGTADQVSVDAGSLFEPDEGLLVGSMSRGLVFVHAETDAPSESDPRPFRVNAGAVHAYLRTTGGETKYLAELESGDEVQVVDASGHTREAIVGRSRIEAQPMIRIILDTEGEGDVETLLRNDDRVALHGSDGPVPVSELEPGDEILFYHEPPGRRVAESIDDRVVEK